MVHELILDIFRKIFENLNIYWILNRLVVSMISFIIALIVSILLKRYVSNRILIKRKNAVFPTFLCWKKTTFLLSHKH